MVQNAYSRYATGIGLATLMAATVLSGPVESRPKSDRAMTLSAGTVIPVKLNDRLSSNESNKGDTFTATVTSEGGASSGVPVGTKVDGYVRQVRAKSGKEPGMIDLAFTRLTLPNGRSYSIDGSPIALDNKSVSHKNGRLIAKPGHGGPNRLTYVGIGAGAGLLVNILAHRKGTLLDTLIGAGAGYGIGSLIKGGSSARDVDLGSGTKLGVRLERRLSLAR